MKRSAYIYILFLWFICHPLLGQNKLTNAIDALKRNELDRGKELIDAAMVDTLFADRASTWYYRGSIYKEIFKQNEKDNKESPAREEAIRSFKKSLEFESDSSGAYANSCNQSLKYLAQTIYNHSATSFDIKNYSMAISLYDKYKEIMLFIEPGVNLTDQDIMFNLALATVYGKIAEDDTSKQEEFFDKAKKLYMEVLEKDSNNISANYNLGILYYNEGVEIVNHMDYSYDLVQLNAVQDQIIKLFKQALPYVLRAFRLNPKRKETLIALQGIYFSLNDIEESEKYKRLLEELEKEEELNPGGSAGENDTNSTPDGPERAE